MATGITKIKNILFNVFERLYNLLGVDVEVRYYDPNEDSEVSIKVPGILFTEKVIKEVESKIQQTEDPLIAIYSTSLQFVAKVELPVESTLIYEDNGNTYIYRITKKTPIGFPGLLFSYELKEVQ